VLIIRRILARQGFEDYISGKLSLFFFLPHRNEKSQGIFAKKLSLSLASLYVSKQ